MKDMSRPISDGYSDIENYCDNKESIEKVFLKFFLSYFTFGCPEFLLFELLDVDIS